MSVLYMKAEYPYLHNNNKCWSYCYYYAHVLTFEYSEINNEINAVFIAMYPNVLYQFRDLFL